MSYRFTFLRHGESAGNQQQVIQGQKDFPLTQKGKAQIERLALEWQSQGKTFDQIISSPLSRAVQTAQIVQKKLDIPVATEPLWLERYGGNLEGKPILDQDGNFAFAPGRQLFDLTGKTGESDWQLYLRAGRAVQALFKNPPGNYLVISHGGLLQQALTIITGTKPEAGDPGFYFQMRNGSYADFEFDTERYFWHFHTLIHPPDEPAEEPLEEGNYRLIFVRHAQSEGNVNGLFQGQMETHLTDEGIRQAEAIGVYLQHTIGQDPIQKLISSPQIRTKLTADRIAKALNLPTTNSDLLKEIHNGEMAGLSGDEIDEKYPERLDQKSPYVPLGDTGESWFELYLRGGEVVDMLLEQPPGTYLVVSHGAILNAIISAMIGLVPRPGRKDIIFRFHNTSYAEIAYSPSQKQWRMFSLTPPELRRSTA